MITYRRAKCGRVDKQRFGPWAVITGASSGIGKEFVRQMAASGIHVALVARREPLLRAVGAECTDAFGVQHYVMALDPSEPGFLPMLADATAIPIGLIPKPHEDQLAAARWRWCIA